MLQSVLRFLDENEHTWEMFYASEGPEAVLNSMNQADSFVYIGNGTNDPSVPTAPVNPDEDAWVMDDAFIEEALAKRKGKKFHRVWLFSCYSSSQKKRWQKAAGLFLGFDGAENHLNTWLEFLRIDGSKRRKPLQAPKDIGRLRPQPGGPPVRHPTR